MNAEKVGQLRELAQSMLEGVQRLEDTKLGPGWDADTERAERYLTETVDALRAADTALWTTLADLEEEYVP